MTGSILSRSSGEDKDDVRRLLSDRIRKIEVPSCVFPGTLFSGVVHLARQALGSRQAEA